MKTSQSYSSPHISVKIIKSAKDGLGFRVQNRHKAPPVRISYLIKGGAAEKANILRVGDIITSVNGCSLENLSYKDALAALRAVPTGAVALLGVQAPEGYIARLETSVDIGGKVRPVRVTDPMLGRYSNAQFRDNVPKLPAIETHRELNTVNGAVISTPPTNKLTLNNGDKIVEKVHNSSVTFTEIKNSAFSCFNIRTKDAVGASDSIMTSKVEQRQDDLNNNTVQLKHESKANGGENGHLPQNQNGTTPQTNGHNKNTTNGHQVVPMKCPFSGSSSEERFVKLKNWETGERITDVLYKKSRKNVNCKGVRCNGSIMTPGSLFRDPRDGPKTKEEMLTLATDFIKEHFASFKRQQKSNPEAEKIRLLEVQTAIEETGTFELNEKELIFGAKTAWRNAPRCIGRIQWNKLHVMDYRHVTTTHEMFEAICKHIKYATNKGNIRSCITFFPPRNDYKKEFRVWNSQYIRYAAYQQEDGSIIGDPVNLEFTQLCEKLGWKGNGGRFDILPLVLQANGEDPDLYDIPEDLILEVHLRHPRYDWFKDLGYKWYAVPAVSNIMLDIGGVEFPAAPFNGWFMGTEIGRDLCDVARYNVLTEIGKHLQLDTKNPSTLWKDVALVEMNIAVIHSFQSDKVTIMDHHSATESFMKHYANEMRIRGGCPGDWVWLVPPISGSATPIFHQEVLNYYLNPACLYQPDAWKYYEWKNNQKGNNSGKKAIKFKELAKSVLLASTMMSKAMANRIKATILYATETGKSYDYAKTLRDIFNHAFDPKIINMEDYDISHLEYESLVLVVTSTFGNGDPPGNGEAFAQALFDETRHDHEKKLTENEQKGVKFSSVSSMAPLSRRQSNMKLTDPNPLTHASGSLANVRFSVFGLGSRAYPHFCAFAHAVDTLFGDMGAERLLEIGEGDELCGQEESFREWAKNVFRVSCETFCVGEDVSVEAASASVAGEDRTWNQEKFRVVDSKEPEEYLYTSLANIRKKKLGKMSLLRRKNLQAESSNRSTLLVELSCDNAQMIYKPGDHLGVYPCNQPELVRALISRLHDANDHTGVIELQHLEQKSTPIGTISNWTPITTIPNCTLFTAFSRFLDITNCPSPQMMKLFAAYAKDESEKTRLEILGEGTSEYEEWKFKNTPNLVEVLEEFSSVQVYSSLLLSQLPPLQCRYYSISSSPEMNPNQIHLTVAVVEYKTRGGDGPIHHGVCSSYLNNISQGDEVIGFIRPARSFHLPDDPKIPCILVGPGTGIAPFRSFWQERELLIKKGVECGPMLLLFGCRYPDVDHLYKEEIKEAMECGAITQYHTAFSRQAGKPKKYVQHVLKDEISSTVVDWVINGSGQIYVCGDVTMADDVGLAIQRILMENMNMTEDAAKLYVIGMKKSPRYNEDIFGITLRTTEVTKRSRERALSFKDI